EGRAQAVRAALPIVAGLSDQVRRQEYAALLADRAGVSASSVLLELQRADRAQGDSQPAASEEPGRGTARPSPPQKAEWEMLKLLAQSPEALEVIGPRLTDYHF